jgi:hypothetical protein
MNSGSLLRSHSIPNFSPFSQIQFLIFVTTNCVSFILSYRKKLQGPPSEFAQHVIPEPMMAALTSDSAWYDLTFTKSDDGTFVWKGEVVVDSEDELDISIFSPYEDKLDIIVQPPNEVPYSLKVALATRDLMQRRSFEGISAPYELPFTSVRVPATSPVSRLALERELTC